ncbi:glycosyl transferase family 2 [Algoriphagus boseongensis]|uniref:Glycosyl transferase family 2 n=1 Tax=Algoriphagus boseongensis TaxID=1442587 RepID=A0A4R6TC02_9BACT|nr:glycosyltransferase [Algoriphagus boseongensis]TDQ19592.1 glycosyl transferase family 2 [Algoriphagus boseongensis]
MRPNLVSILIPNYNKERLLRKTLDSILSQKYQEWECIIVDDRSTDNSFEILKEYGNKDSRFKIFERPLDIPKGANFCRNYAYSLSQGEFIQWFDSDDIMYPWFLEKKVNYLKGHPKTPVVIAKGDLKIDEKFEGNTKFKQSYFSENPIEDYLEFRLIFFTGGPMVRRYVYEKVGLFNIKLRRHQEWELYLRVILHQAKWGVIEQPCFRYLLHGNSITSRYQEKKKVVESELVLFQEVLNLPSDRFKNQIPKKTKVRLAFRYFMVATYHKRLKYSITYLKTFFRETFKPEEKEVQEGVYSVGSRQ